MASRAFRVRCTLAILIASTAAALADSPTCVIFMIGDGMGFEHVKATGMYLNGTAGTLSFESLPYQAQVTTYSASSSVTDSAAAASAMATGRKVNNGVISMAYPGDGSELTTLLEIYKARGSRVGLVTTDAMTGATPSGFGAHEPSRNNTDAIAADFLNQTRPNTLLGGGGNGMTTAAAIAAGYTVVTTRNGLLGIDTSIVSMLSGQFGTGRMPYEYDGVGTLPHLSQMATVALDILDNDPDGFFLMIEGGNIDPASHNNDLPRMIFETVEFHNTAQIAIDWAVTHPGTLLLITADHETGGLTVLENNGQGNLPTVSWSTGSHTGANVPIYAYGFNAQYVTGTLDNTDLFKLVNNPDPALVVAPSSLSKTVEQGQNLPPNTDSFTVSNAGLGTLDYTIEDDAAWLSTDPASGSCTSETDTIGLVYSTSGLTPGPYVGTITVSNNSVSPPELKTVTVNLTVESGIPADFDQDGDVDMADFAHFQKCLTGPSAPITDQNCTSADLNDSDHVDADDLDILIGCMSAPEVLGDPQCAN